VEEVETDVDGIGWGEYLRVRITLDLSKPLAQVRLLKIKGVSTWIAFQYERLPKFCFLCGVIRHGIRGCLGRKVLLSKGLEHRFSLALGFVHLLRAIVKIGPGGDRRVLAHGWQWTVLDSLL
jgi:hypothetical protein